MTSNIYDNNNIFAKILRKEIPADIVYEDDSVLAFKDVAPAAPVHVLVIPKLSCRSFADFTLNAKDSEVGNFFKTVNDVAQNLELDNGFRVITNIGYNGSQTVEHFHVHILGGKQLGGLLSTDNLTR
jgi:histidine triad (HIT) family protein